MLKRLPRSNYFSFIILMQEGFKKLYYSQTLLEYCETFKSLWWSACSWAFRYIKILKWNHTLFIERLSPVIDFELKKSSYLNTPYTACREGSDPVIISFYSKLLSELWIWKQTVRDYFFFENKLLVLTSLLQAVVHSLMLFFVKKWKYFFSPPGSDIFNNDHSTQNRKLHQSVVTVCFRKKIIPNSFHSTNLTSKTFFVKMILWKWKNNNGWHLIMKSYGHILIWELMILTKKILNNLLILFHLL